MNEEYKYVFHCFQINALESLIQVLTVLLQMRLRIREF